MSGRQNKFPQTEFHQYEPQQRRFKRLASNLPLLLPQGMGRRGPRAGALFFCSLLSVIAISACGEKPLPAGENEFAAGIAALELGDTAQAQTLFAKAEQNDPGRPWRKLGQAREIELYSSPFGAMRTYLEIMSLAPDFDSAYTAYCRLALRFGKPRLAWNAVQLYSRNREVNTDRDASQTTSAGRNYSLIVARVLQLRGETDEAVSRLENLSRSFPHDGEVTIALASAMLQQGRTDEALALTRRTLDENNERRAVVSAAIRFYVDAGYAEDALELLSKVRGRENSKNIRANRLAVETYLRLGYVEYAAYTVSQMKQQPITTGLAYYLNGEIAEARGSFIQAREWYLYSLSFEKKNIELFRDAARAATGAKNFIQMEDNMNSALVKLSTANYPADYVADAHLQYAEFYVSLKQWRPALDELEKARSSFAETPRFELLRAQTLYSSQAKDSARVAFSRLVSRNGSSFEWLRGLGLTFVQIGEYDSADVYIQKALQSQPNDFISLVARVDIARKRTDVPDSAGYERAVEDVVRAYPRNKRTLRIHADYYLSRGDNISALEAANRMIELYPGDLSAYSYAASLAGSRYGLQQGLKYLLESQERNAGIPTPYRKLASYFLHQGELDSAIAYWTKAYTIDSTDEATLLTKGVILEAQGFPDSAIIIYKRMIEVNPFSAEAFNNLAWVMANNNLEPAQAANFAREAVALSGGVNGNMQGALGWALFKEKKYQQASVAMQSAIRFDSQDPFKRFLYGSVLEEWGKNAEASEQYQQALDLGISGGYRKAVEDALSRLKK